MSSDQKPHERHGVAEDTWDDRFRAILASSLDAVITMDAEGRIVDWNPQAERIFGWTKQEAAGRKLGELIIPPAYRDAHQEGLERFHETGEGPVLGQRLEMSALRKNGREFPVELSVIAIPLGGSFLFNAFLRDISKRTEDAEYRARMAALVDSSYDAIIGKDIAGKITSWNAGAERVYGYSEDEAVGQTIKLILPTDVDQEEPEILHAMQTGQRLEQFETVRRRKDRTLIPVSLTLSPIADDSGVIIGSSTVERDITESQRYKKELRRAKEEAEEANRARAEFLANVSHELRTPMNAIIGMTQLALGEELTEDIRDYIHTANDSAHSLLTLLNDILDFSKLESGKFTIENEPFRLRETIDETVKTLSSRAFEKGLELACEVAGQVPDLLIGDAIRLRQVLTNLISNAIKFTEQGEVLVAVESSSLTPKKSNVRFSVCDTGVGISPDDQRRILEPFTQVDASTTRRYGGTGLGLAICSELLHLMGSRLSIKSKPGEGSCFSFELPLDQVKSERNSHNVMPLEQLRNMPVLVVDDNETNRRILEETLDSWKMRPETVSDGEQALGRLGRARNDGSPIPLVIVDAIMPKMDGFSLSRQISELTAKPPQVILMLSSFDRSEFKQREEHAGISAYLQKPVSQSDLLDAVMRAMNVQAPRMDERQESFAPFVSAALNVLLAEDTPANQKVVTSVLKKRGHEVTIAHNGREAVELSRKRSFDVILMDIQMPIMDGFQATAAIREQEANSSDSTPIIAMTAHAMRGDREKCLDAGMNAYIAKPIDVNELLELVESISRGERSTSSVGGDSESIDRSRGADDDADVDDVIDMEGTMQRLAGDTELLREFITYFDEDSPQLLNALRGGIEENDASVVQRAAHSLKGLAANFGAKHCLAVAQQLEKAGETGELKDATTLLSQLEHEVARLDRALAEHRG